jgi:hypothetical protein
MPKSLKPNKHDLIYIVVLFLGIGIGYTMSRSFDRAPTSLAESPPSTSCVTENSSMAAEPKEELLTAPEFKETGTIHSSKDGLILVRWSESPGAQGYNVRVWDSGGSEIKNFKAPKTFTFLKNLPVNPKQKETPYFVVVTPIGDGEARGQDSEKKKVAMLPLRNIDAPTIKSIVTEQEDSTPQ